ncbi:hypothetical protein M2323_002701 [Rhodoblastus acidophilus]|nr:hypothetical protein [Rhodoblastus acidophilus]
MAGLVPAIHAAPQRELPQNDLSRVGVDARDKPGHDVPTNEKAARSFKRAAL